MRIKCFGPSLSLTLSFSTLTQPSSVTLTDVHSEVLNLLDKNTTVLSKLTKIPADVQELDWCSYDKLGEYDLVIGADLLYDPAVFEDLVKLLAKFETKIILAATIRNESTFEIFCNLCQSYSLTIEYLAYSVEKGSRFNFDRSTTIKIVEIKKL